MVTLKDSFGRTFPYIRLSITDVCNFKCGYCLPNGYQVDKSDNRKFLHLEEIRRLAKVFPASDIAPTIILDGLRLSLRAQPSLKNSGEKITLSVPYFFCKDSV